MVFGLKKLYHRYSVMTGTYMLEPIEAAILHLAYFIGIYFLIRYTSAFLAQVHDLDIFNRLLSQ